MADAYASIQALQAQIRQAEYSQALTAASSSSSSTASSGGTMTFLSTPVSVYSGSAINAWTSVTGVVPAGASAVILDGFYSNSSGSTTWAYFYVRSSSADTSGRFLLASQSGAAGDTSSGPGFGIFPVNTDGSFQWSTNTANMTVTVRVVGYVR